MESLTVDVAVIVCMIALSAFFSSSETAIVSSNRYKVRKLVDRDVDHARTLQELINMMSNTISAILIGNNIVNIAASSIATVIFVRVLGAAMGPLVSTIVMTVLVLVFGEIVPKTLANRNPEKFALRVSAPIRFLVRIFSPVIYILSKVTERFYRKPADAGFTEDDLITILNVSHEEGILEGEEKAMLQNVFTFADTQAKDLMTPRTSITALPLDTAPEELLGLVKDLSFSRIPVYDENIDDIVGILHVKDLVGIDLAEGFSLRNILRPANFHYESKSSFELLSEMKRGRYTMAVILDEYGGTAGLVTIEDIVEEVVGDIDDEYDEADQSIRKLTAETYSVRGDVDLESVNELLHSDFTSDDYESIGGYITGLAGKFPSAGEVYSDGLYDFVIEEAGPAHIERVRIRRRKK